MGYNPSYKWTNPTYPIYNQGCNPLTKWDEPPSISIKFRKHQRQHETFSWCSLIFQNHHGSLTFSAVISLRRSAAGWWFCAAWKSRWSHGQEPGGPWEPGWSWCTLLIWGFRQMEVLPILDGFCHGKSHRSKWMMTWGTPIYGNPQWVIIVDSCYPSVFFYASFPSFSWIPHLLPSPTLKVTGLLRSLLLRPQFFWLQLHVAMCNWSFRDQIAV